MPPAQTYFCKGAKMIVLLIKYIKKSVQENIERYFTVKHKRVDF